MADAKGSFKFNVYVTGVGGQGIGLLSEVVLRAYDHAGYNVRGVDTHGLAQRGGIVRSHIRVGREVYNPIIEPGDADIVLALERTEALRSILGYCREGGTLAYYDASWQPLDVRLKKARAVTGENLHAAAKQRTIKLLRVFVPDLPDTKMQNMALLSMVLKEGLLKNLAKDHVRAALNDLLMGKVLEANLSLF